MDSAPWPSFMLETSDSIAPLVLRQAPLNKTQLKLILFMGGFTILVLGMSNSVCHFTAALCRAPELSTALRYFYVHPNVV